ncbi:hypothetical protein [Phnomibacter sp. MR]|uniref:hypothetical protein n=1 Tax=Phnomibacter sp. MR TaxID=3042318 RepID=UPI003A80F344
MQQTMNRRWLLPAIVVVTAIVLLQPPFGGFAQSKAAKLAAALADTTRKKSVTMAEAEARLAEAMEALKKAMAAMPKDAMEQARAGMQTALQQLDTKAVEASLQAAKAQLEAIRLNKDIQQHLSKEALAEIETELANARQLQATEMASAMQEIKAALAGKEKEMQQAMAEAQVQMKAAQAQLEKTQEGLKELKKDGLLKEEEQVQIEWKEGTLYINGVAQNKAVSEKYKQYFGEGQHSSNKPGKRIVL